MCKISLWSATEVTLWSFIMRAERLAQRESRSQCLRTQLRTVRFTSLNCSIRFSMRQKSINKNCWTSSVPSTISPSIWKSEGWIDILVIYKDLKKIKINEQMKKLSTQKYSLVIGIHFTHRRSFLRLNKNWFDFDAWKYDSSFSPAIFLFFTLNSCPNLASD